MQLSSQQAQAIVDARIGQRFTLPHPSRPDRMASFRIAAADADGNVLARSSTVQRPGASPILVCLDTGDSWFIAKP